jgi:hypothetical protein
MTVRLTVKLQAVDDAPELLDGWRGLVDFGEIWTESDAALWPSGSGDVPVGNPLIYGCELRLYGSDREVGEAVLSLMSIDTPRSVMTQGAKIRLLDGQTLRATGELLHTGV